MATMTLDEVVKKYVELRDKKDVLRADYDASVAKIDEKLRLIEGKVMEYLDDAGAESIKTQFGTAYTAESVSVTSADKGAFVDFVKEKSEWGLADIRVSKTGVEQYLQAGHDLPPGVNYRRERVLRVKRAS